MDEVILDLKSVNKTYVRKNNGRNQEVRAARNVSFALNRKHILALVGESGSGKSTLAKLITGVEKPDNGEITFEGKSLREWTRSGSLNAYRKNVQMVFQDPFAALNPLNEIGYAIGRPLVNYRKLSGKQLNEMIHHILQVVQLTPPAEFQQKLPFELSGGQLQRVVIGRAIASSPKLIVADEPVSMLDVSIRADILRLMEKLRDTENVSFLYITHDLVSARALADEIIVLYRGTIVEHGPADELALDPLHPYTQLLLSSIPNPWASHETEPALPASSVPLKTSSTACVFYGRCPFAIDKCRHTPPALEQVSSNRFVACFLHNHQEETIQSETTVAVTKE